MLQDVYKTAEAIRALGYKVTKEPGPLPGLGTKITACEDPDGWKVSQSLSFSLVCRHMCSADKPTQSKSNHG